VAKTVVHFLQEIEIDNEQGQRMIVTLRAAQLDRQRRLKKSMIRQTR
jgi:hypothetical protein